MTGQIKRMNWVKTRSAWEQTQAWQKQRAATRQIYEQQNAAAQAAFGNAFSSQVTGIGDLAIQQATKRIEAARAAKVEELQKTVNEFV